MVRSALSRVESTDPTSAFKNTWSQFSTGGTSPANIQTWQGRKLYYYRNDPNGTQGTTIIGFEGCALDEESLLLNEAGQSSAAGHNSGQWGSFAYLLIGALAINGIASGFTKIRPIDGSLFMVNDWQIFGRTPSDHSYQLPDYDPNYQWRLILNQDAVDSPNFDIMVPAPQSTPGQTGVAYGDVLSLTTLPGQNSAPPSEKIFNFHFFVHVSLAGITPSYYDPSYGVKYVDAQDFERRAVAGYLKSFLADVPTGTHQENTYWVRPACDRTRISCLNRMAFYQ